MNRKLETGLVAWFAEPLSVRFRMRGSSSSRAHSVFFRVFTDGLSHLLTVRLVPVGIALWIALDLRNALPALRQTRLLSLALGVAVLSMMIY